MQTLDGIPLDDLHDGLWEKLPDIAKPAAYLWGRRPESAAAVTVIDGFQRTVKRCSSTVSVTPVPSAAFPPRAIRHLFKYSVSMFCSFFIRFPEVCRAGVLLWMHPRHCRNVPRRRFRYRFRSIRILCLLAEFAALGCSEIAECTSDHRQQFYEICVAQTAEPAVHELPQVVVQQQYRT